MKRSILIIMSIAFLSAGTLGLTGCESESTEIKNGDELAKYECPMDCENGKKYDEMGTCPVCKMDLVKVEM